MKKHIHVIYKGAVQGVGFRFTSERVAEEFEVKGWVKNLANGNVEIAAEAEEESLKNFLGKINKAFSSYIEDIDIKWSDYTGEFKKFGIKF